MSIQVFLAVCIVFPAELLQARLTPYSTKLRNQLEEAHLSVSLIALVTAQYVGGAPAEVGRVAASLVVLQLNLGFLGVLLWFTLGKPGTTGGQY